MSVADENDEIVAELAELAERHTSGMREPMGQEAGEGGLTLILSVGEGALKLIFA